MTLIGNRINKGKRKPVVEPGRNQDSCVPKCWVALVHRRVLEGKLGPVEAVDKAESEPLAEDYTALQVA